MAERLDRARLLLAFECLGDDLARRGLFVELAVYGGSALMLQFAWRRSTEDVDALVREGFDQAALLPSVAAVAERLGLDADWLNNAVGMFTPLAEADTLFALSGTYPTGAVPGLRVFLARPAYLLAMKLHALGAIGRGSRDMDDARALAEHLGLGDRESLLRLYEATYGGPPPPEALLRFSAVLGRGGAEPGEPAA